MFSLVNGIPKFYIGKINGEYGYSSEEEKQRLIQELKLEDYTDEKIVIDEEYKKIATELGEKQLTYSKGEFLQLLEIELENKDKPKEQEVINTLLKTVSDLQMEMVMLKAKGGK